MSSPQHNVRHQRNATRLSALPYLLPRVKLIEGRGARASIRTLALRYSVLRWPPPQGVHTRGAQPTTHHLDCVERATATQARPFDKMTEELLEYSLPIIAAANLLVPKKIKVSQIFFCRRWERGGSGSHSHSALTGLRDTRRPGPCNPSHTRFSSSFDLTVQTSQHSPASHHFRLRWWSAFSGETVGAPVIIISICRVQRGRFRTMRGDVGSESLPTCVCRGSDFHLREN